MIIDKSKCIKNKYNLTIPKIKNFMLLIEKKLVSQRFGVMMVLKHGVFSKKLESHVKKHHIGLAYMMKTHRHMLESLDLALKHMVEYVVGVLQNSFSQMILKTTMIWKFRTDF